MLARQDLLRALGLLNLAVRRHPTSAPLLCNALVQAGLFPLEILAYGAGTLTQLAGAVPNSILHVLLTIGSLYDTRRTTVSTAELEHVASARLPQVLTAARSETHPCHPRTTGNLPSEKSTTFVRGAP